MTTPTPEEQATLAKLRAGTHVVVPVVPTEVMLLFGHRAQEMVEYGIKPIWSAMITAAAQEAE